MPPIVGVYSIVYSDLHRLTARAHRTISAMAIQKVKAYMISWNMDARGAIVDMRLERGSELRDEVES